MNVGWPSRRANLDYSGNKQTVFVATTYSALQIESLCIRSQLATEILRFNISDQTSAKHHLRSVRVEHTAASGFKRFHIRYAALSPRTHELSSAQFRSNTLRPLLLISLSCRRIVNKSQHKSFARSESSLANEKCMTWHFRVSTHVQSRLSLYSSRFSIKGRLSSRQHAIKYLSFFAHLISRRGFCSDRNFLLLTGTH